jgi:hypothetical protein
MAELPGNVNFIKGEGEGGQTGGGDIESRKVKEESGERRGVTRAHTSAVQAKDEMSTEVGWVGKGGCPHDSSH